MDLITLLLAALSFWGGYTIGNKAEEPLIIEHGCKAPIAILNPTQRPPKLPESFSCLDLYEVLPMYNDALRACNRDKDLYSKEAERINNEILNKEKGDK